MSCKGDAALKKVQSLGMSVVVFLDTDKGAAMSLYKRQVKFCLQ